MIKRYIENLKQVFAPLEGLGSSKKNIAIEVSSELPLVLWDSEKKNNAQYFITAKSASSFFYR